MADDQDSSNDIGEAGDAPEVSDYDDTTIAAIEQTTTSLINGDYDDEPIEDYVVKLVVNEQPDGAISSDLVNAVVTDAYGNAISSKATLYDSINGYTTALYDELNGNGTAITGGKRWWEPYLSKTGSLSSQGWSTKKLIFAGLLALCILGIILVIVFLVLGKKFKKNKRSTPAGPTTTTKAVVTKNVSPDPKYQPVPNV